MTVLSHTEENYIKCIFSLSETKDGNISTNAIADRLGTTAASVTDMIKRLAGKSIVHYEKYYGVSLTEAGQQVAVNLIRRHRLWETFLVDKLGFHWDEVHDMAEELEHVASDLLTERLDAFLGKPRFDPHGDPIPDSKGNISYHEDVTLDKVDAGKKGIIVGVTDHTPAF
ncbi:MAG: iron-dependent repressor, partial [Sphingobacteriales bacterium BACL12 MAG-120813-bin55]